MVFYSLRSGLKDRWARCTRTRRPSGELPTPESGLAFSSTPVAADCGINMRARDQRPFHSPRHAPDWVHCTGGVHAPRHSHATPYPILPDGASGSKVLNDLPPVLPSLRYSSADWCVPWIDRSPFRVLLLTIGLNCCGIGLWVDMWIGRSIHGRSCIFVLVVFSALLEWRETLKKCVSVVFRTEFGVLLLR